MKIVIDIPKEQYKRICDHTDGVHDMVSLLTIIENGIPLPKGHGRLIDADEIYLIDENFYVQSDYTEAEMAIAGAPTIIESDEEGEE